MTLGIKPMAVRKGILHLGDQGPGLGVTPIVKPVVIKRGIFNLGGRGRPGRDVTPDIKPMVVRIEIFMNQDRKSTERH